MKINGFEINDRVLEWLLDEVDPPVRYRTLTWLLGLSDTDLEVKKARKNTLNSPVVKAILNAESPEGYWISPKSIYSPTYKASLHQLVILSEFGVPSCRPVIKACEFILAKSLVRGGISQSGGPSSVIPCETGIILWALIQFGYQDDPRVKAMIDWILKYQRTDDGDRPPRLDAPMWPSNEKPSMSHYKIHGNINNCWSLHSCHMGVVKTLWGLSAISEDRRSAEVKSKIKDLTEFVLRHRLYKKNQHGFVPMRKGWVNFGFPRFIYTDVLDIARIISTAGGIGDKRADDAVKLIAEKQNEEGKWIMETSFNGKMWADIEKKGEPSRWLTLHALYVLKNSYKAKIDGKTRK